MGNAFAPLNPDGVYGRLSLVLLAAGLASWQSVVAFSCAVSDDMAKAYSAIFFALGQAGLFGGLCITYSNLPLVFLPSYYSAIPALTFRALLMNDLFCCHVEASCATLATDFMNTTQRALVPAVAMQSCADPDAIPGGRGNVGRIALSALDMKFSASKYSLLAQILAWGAFYRLAAAWLLGFRLKRERAVRQEGDEVTFSALQKDLQDKEEAGAAAQGRRQ